MRYTAITAGYGALAAAVIAAGLTLAGLATLPGPAQFAAAGWEIAYITVGAALLGTLCWNSGIRRVGADGVLFINVVPVTAFVIGIVQGYKFNWAELTGAFLVVAALFANHFPGRPIIARPMP